MAFTQSELDALKSAYAKGVLTVTHDGKTVTYASEADLWERIRKIENSLRSESDRPKAHKAAFYKGR